MRFIPSQMVDLDQYVNSKEKVRIEARQQWQKKFLIPAMLHYKKIRNLTQFQNIQKLKKLSEKQSR
jgi:hypothetical protein